MDDRPPRARNERPGKQNAAAPDVWDVCLAGLLFLVIFGVGLFVSTHFESILGCAVIFFPCCPVSPLMVALFVTYLLHRR